MKIWFVNKSSLLSMFWSVKIEIILYFNVQGCFFLHFACRYIIALLTFNNL